MKRYMLILIGFLVFGSLPTTIAYADPITYTAEGVAAYEEIIVDANGVGHVIYDEIALWGSVTFDDEIEVHTTDKTYYTYTMLDFQISTSLDLWTGSTGLLHWESDDYYPPPQDQYPGFRNLYMAGFLGWFSQFDFNEADGSDYPYDDMTQWLQLPPQIEIWSDNLLNTGASYVSFTLHAPEEHFPIPEPLTAFLFGTGIVGFAVIRISRKRNFDRGQ